MGFLDRLLGRPERDRSADAQQNQWGQPQQQGYPQTGPQGFAQPQQPGYQQDFGQPYGQAPAGFSGEPPKKKRTGLVITAVVAVLASALPMLTGRIAPVGATSGIPDYWTDAASWLGIRLVDEPVRHVGWGLLLDGVVEHVETRSSDVLTHVRGRYVSGS